MVVFFDHENPKLGLKNHKFMLTFDRVIVILRKFFNGRRLFCLTTTCTIIQCTDKSIIFLPCICYLENIKQNPSPPPMGRGGLYLAHGLRCRVSRTGSAPTPPQYRDVGWGRRYCCNVRKTSCFVACYMLYEIPSYMQTGTFKTQEWIQYSSWSCCPG